MTNLTRRRVNDGSGESWQIFYGDVRVGMIGRRTGNPTGTDGWKWYCGFYPGSHPGEQKSGTAATFDDGRAAFEAAWRDYLPKRTEADFQEWRDHDAWTKMKYATFDAGGRLPPPSH